MISRLAVVPLVASLSAGGVALAGDCIPPTVPAGERDFAACPQTDGTLTVQASGSSLHYQWRRYPRFGNTPVPVPNSDSPVLTIPSVFISDAGLYDCIVSNTCGSVTTERYRFAVLAVDRGTIGGIQGSDGVVTNDDFIVYINQFFSADVRADIGSVGATPLPDGQFDNNDFIVFIDLYFNFPGCP